MQTAQLATYTRHTTGPSAAHDYDLHATHPADAPDAALGARLNYLVAAINEAERRARLFRTPQEESEARLMRRPITTEQAFARFGLLLGLLPPAAIFGRIAFGTGTDTGAPFMLVFFVPMLLICATLGRYMGKRVGAKFGQDGHVSRWRTIERALEGAFVWAAATGTAGGVPVFFLGGVLGFACALPVALVAFSLFAPLHRLLARGDMIDARHLHPLAWGINLAIAALILSPHIIPY